MNSWKSTLLSAWAHHRNGQGRLGGAAQEQVERLTRLGGGGLRHRERDAQDRVGAKAALVGSPVEVDQRAVDRALLSGPGARQRTGDLVVYVGDRARHPLA
jgi:hypothetical protein